MPLGLSRNKLAPPLTPKLPKISEILLPVTRVKILVIPSGLAKSTLAPLLTLNSEKLWNKLLSRIAPPSIKSVSVSWGVTIELSAPKLLSGTIWAFAGEIKIKLNKQLDANSNWGE